MFRLVRTLLVGILSASLAVIYQNDIAAFVGRAPITVQITVGPWFPLPQSADANRSFTAADEENITSFAQGTEHNFARLIISNNTGKTIDSAYVRINESDDLDLYHAVILKKQNKQVGRSVVLEAEKTIDIGPLPAAEATTVYLWSDRSFSWPYDAEDIEVLTSDESASTTVTKVEASSDEIALGTSTETIAWVFVFLLIGLCAALLYALNHGFKFSKALLKDDDYYLGERMRFESDPKKYSVPDKLPE